MSKRNLFKKQTGVSSLVSAMNNDNITKQSKKFTSDTANISIEPSLKAFLPKLSDSEFNILEKQIIQDGCRDALLIWKKSDNERILLDGHNRYAICSKHKFEFNIEELTFTSIEAVKEFMLTLQMGKRNLDKDQISYFRGLRYTNLKGSYGGDRKSNPQNEDLKKTAETVADEFNVSKATIERDSLFFLGINKLPEDVSDMFWARKIKVSKQYIEKIVRMDETNISSYLIGKLKLVGDNLTDKDLLWFKSYEIQKRTNTSINQDLDKLLSTQTKQILKYLQTASDEQKSSMIDHYTSIIDLIRNNE